MLDLAVPGMDACEVCRTLKGDDKLRSIPVIVLTAGRADRDSRLRALEEGADAFLSPPCDEVELVALVRTMARIKAGNERQRQEADRRADVVAECTGELERVLTGRKRTEETIRESEACFRSLVESAPEAVFVQSGSRFVYVNSAMVRLAAPRGRRNCSAESSWSGWPRNSTRPFANASGSNARPVKPPPQEQEYLRLDGAGSGRDHGGGHPLSAEGCPSGFRP